LLGEKSAEQKQQQLKDLRDLRGIETMMIGDGLNDILSLQESSVGVSINAKSELNLLACDVVALNENIWKIPILF
jgi:Cu+-exporting ATPase